MTRLYLFKRDVYCAGDVADVVFAGTTDIDDLESGSRLQLSGQLLCADGFVHSVW